MIDETGDRKWSTKTAHVGRQYLGSIGKIDQGVVSVTSLWADEGCYVPLGVEPYTPAPWLKDGKADKRFRTKPQLGLSLVDQALARGWPFRAVVADSFYGEHGGFKQGLEQRGVGYVLALKPSHGWWHWEDSLGSVKDVAAAAQWRLRSCFKNPNKTNFFTKSVLSDHTQLPIFLCFGNHECFAWVAHNIGFREF